MPQVNYISDKQLSTRLSISRASIWRWTQQGKFPKPVKLGPGCTRWRVSDIEIWEEKRGARA